jgi:hypothetical protein
MSRKNFKVDTAANGQTAKQDTKHAFSEIKRELGVVEKTNVPTGKVKNTEDRRKAREESYKQFRVNALKRRAQRMGLTEEQTKVKIDQLLKQMDEPATYNMIVTYHVSDKDMLIQALKKEDIVWKIMVNPTRRCQDAYCIIEADKDVLDYLRGLNIPTLKIYPYVKKKPAIIEALSRKKSDYVAKNNDKSKTPKGIRNARKAMIVAAMIEHLKELKANGVIKQTTANMLKRTYVAMHNDHKLAAKLQKEVRTKHERKLKKQEMLLKKKLEKRRQEAKKRKAGTIVPMNAKKASESPKTASKTLKQAA